MKSYQFECSNPIFKHDFLQIWHFLMIFIFLKADLTVNVFQMVSGPYVLKVNDKSADFDICPLTVVNITS